ncbi:MAG: Sir2 family NAD-dependent protein deacetylase [Hyphomicrobiales bacterium]|nr:Sir2 family NAD-dependent protein deacetylase [Hyphomicrobiales bacterium]
MPDLPLPTLQSAFAAARRIVVMSGAGLSTECGVPDFRSRGSPWLTHPPIAYADYLASPTLRNEAWRRKFALDDTWAGARPGRGHKALAAMVASGHVIGIITQNIDGLHQASGVPAAALAELHGNGTFAACLSCGMRYELATLRAEFAGSGSIAPCGCGGIIKSATISFGQAMPKEPLARAEAWARGCDLFIVVGSSLLVQPAASLPLVARQAGARLAIINREATPLDPLADMVLHAEVGPVLSALHVHNQNVPQNSEKAAVATIP